VALFLSAEWIEALDHAIAASDTLRKATAGRRLVLQQVVEPKPADRHDYFMTLADGQAHAHAGLADESDVRFRTDYRTAVAISLGQDSAQASFMRGRLQIDGDIDALLQNTDLFAELDDLFVPLRSTTSY
jgi:hypothetical protein